MPKRQTPSKDEQRGLVTTEPEYKFLRVIRLETQNIKRVKAVGITPKAGKPVIIGGYNFQGKSSVIDSLAYAIGGKDLMPDETLRRGETSGSIRVDLGELVVERRFTQNGETLTVTGKDGLKRTSPQTLLDKLAGDLMFDPMLFLRMDKKKQLAAVQKIAGIDFTQINLEYDNIFAERTTNNRTVKSLQAEFDGAVFYPDAPDEETTVSALATQLQSINTLNASIDEALKADREAIAEVGRIGDRQVEIEEQIAQLRAEAARLTKRDQELVAYRSRIAEDLLAAGEKKDPLVVVNQMATVEATNEKVRANATRTGIETKLTAAKKTTNRLTADLERLQAEKKRQLSEAKFPVPGLSFDDEQVLYNGFAFQEGVTSQAELIRVSFAMSVAMNKPLRLCLIRQGALLDDNQLALVEELAEQYDCQAWIERVGEGEEVQVIIEDGLVKEVRA